MALIHQVYDTDAHFKIDPVTRVIKNESSGKNVLIQGDHNSERFTFEIPKLIDGHDMSKCNSVQVHYINIDSNDKTRTSADVYDVNDLQISPEDAEVVICSWLIDGNATKYAGSLAFLLKFKCVDTDGSVSYVWNTARYSSISVSSGIDNGEAVVEEHSDILAQWEARIAALEANAGGDVEAILNAELGTVKEAFPVSYNLDEEIDVGKYYRIIDIVPEYAQNTELLGKTLCVKTYACGDMAYKLRVFDWNDGSEEEIENNVVNPDADIDSNPESGVCEFEIAIPETLEYSELQIFIPIAENPYIEDVEIWEKKSTVWGEIAKVSKNGIIASGCGTDYYWRKWGDGFAECWIDIYADANYPEEAVADMYVPLPIDFCIDHAPRVVANITGRVDDEIVVYSAAMPMAADLLTANEIYLRLQVPHNLILSFEGKIYATGYWKVKEEAWG